MDNQLLFAFQKQQSLGKEPLEKSFKERTS